jgi:phosphatidylserine decarboxylase
MIVRIIVILIVILIVLIILYTYFNRAPIRISNEPNNIPVSPADGKVMYAKDRTIVLFLNLHDVHAQYTPLKSTVKNIKVIDGQHNRADSLIKSNHNKSVKVTFNTAIGDIIVYQRVGFLVRRIINTVVIGQQLERDDIYGKITFGSRVDIILPTGYKTSLKKGEKVTGGITPLF